MSEQEHPDSNDDLANDPGYFLGDRLQRRDGTWVDLRHATQADVKEQIRRLRLRLRTDQFAIRELRRLLGRLGDRLTGQTTVGDLTFICSECGFTYEGEPAFRSEFDEAVRQIMSEKEEGAISDILAEHGLRMDSPSGLYELCAACLAEARSGETTA